MKKLIILSVVFTDLLIIDQWTKYLAVSKMKLGETIPIIPDFFNFTLVHNRGAAFGIFSDLPDSQRHIVMGVVTTIALAVLIRFLIVEGREDFYFGFIINYSSFGRIGKFDR